MNANRSARPISSCPLWLRAVETRIDGQVVEVTASMYGRVERVLITENQLVEKGDLLVEFDHRELDGRVEAAAAELDRAVVEGAWNSRPRRRSRAFADGTCSRA